MWARAVAAGIDDALFWELTPDETSLLLTEIAEREGRIRQLAVQLAGTIAATIVNTTPRRSRRAYSWRDFFVMADAAENDTPEGLRSALLQWAASTKGVRVS